MDWRVVSAVAACLSLAHAALAAEPLFDANRPLQIADQGVFSIPGRYVQTEAGTIMVGQMYVEVRIPAKQTHPYPVIMVHGGSMSGFKSDFYFLPDSGIGAVLLTNSDNGGMLTGPFGRRLLEVVFDGKLEAAGDVAAQAATYKAELAKRRERLVVPAAPALVAGLAKRYSSKELGDLAVLTQHGVTLFDLGEWISSVASRKNDDGSISIITIDPGTDGFEFVVGERGGKRVLIIRDGQHEYIFTEAA